MSKAYVKRNITGGYDGWETLVVEDGDVKNLQRQTMETNIKIMELVKQECPKDFTEGERVAVFNTVSRHYHYAIEDFIDEQIEKGVYKR